MKNKFKELANQYFKFDYSKFYKNNPKNEGLFTTLHKVIIKFPEKDLFSKKNFNRLNAILSDYFRNDWDSEKNRKLILILCSYGIFDRKFVTNLKLNIAEQLESDETNKLISDIQKRKDVDLLYAYNFSKIKDSIKSMKIDDLDEELVALLCAGDFFREVTKTMRLEIAKLFRTNLPNEIVEFIYAEKKVRQIAITRKRFLNIKNSIVEKKIITIPVCSLFFLFSVYMIFFVKNQTFEPNYLPIEMKSKFALINFDSIEKNEKIEQRLNSNIDVKIEKFIDVNEKNQKIEFFDSKLSEEIKVQNYDELFFSKSQKTLYMKKYLSNSEIKNIEFTQKENE